MKKRPVDLARLECHMGLLLGGGGVFSSGTDRSKPQEVQALQIHLQRLPQRNEQQKAELLPPAEASFHQISL